MISVRYNIKPHLSTHLNYSNFQLIFTNDKDNERYNIMHCLICWAYQKISQDTSSDAWCCKASVWTHFSYIQPLAYESLDIFNKLLVWILTFIHVMVSKLNPSSLLPHYKNRPRKYNILSSKQANKQNQKKLPSKAFLACFCCCYFFWAAEFIKNLYAKIVSV